MTKKVHKLLKWQKIFLGHVTHQHCTSEMSNQNLVEVKPTNVGGMSHVNNRIYLRSLDSKLIVEETNQY